MFPSTPNIDFMAQYEKYFIDHTNKKWLWEKLETEDEVNEVADYLQKNNLKIKMSPFRDGCHVVLEDVDLSGNGCCFEPKNLLNHVRYFRKLKEISETDDFKNWLSNYEMFNIVKRYVIEYDCRWISTTEIKAVIEKQKTSE